jgi:hypothetical protein
LLKLILSYLEYVREISKVEDVVELDGSWEEGRGHLLMEFKSSVNQSLCIALDL